MKFKKLLSFSLMTVIFFVLSRSIIQNWSLIKSLPWHFSTPDLILLLCFLLPIYLINGSTWFFVLRALGNKSAYLQSIRIWLLSNVSRFIPGVVWQYGGRIYLSSNAKIPVNTTITALLVEPFFILTTSLIVVFTTFSFWHFPIETKLFRIAFIILTLPVVAIALLNNQKILIKIAAIYKKITGKEGEIRSLSISPYWVAVLFVSYLLQFIFAGSTLFFLAKLVTNLDSGLYAIFIGIFAASWLVGYITMIAPAGLGVQEISIATMLSVYMPFPVATVIAVLFRIALLVSESVTIFLVSLLFKHKS